MSLITPLTLAQAMQKKFSDFGTLGINFAANNSAAVTPRDIGLALQKAAQQLGIDGINPNASAVNNAAVDHTVLNLLLDKAHTILEQNNEVKYGDAEEYPWHHTDDGDRVATARYTASGTLICTGNRNRTPTKNIIFSSNDYGININSTKAISLSTNVIPVNALIGEINGNLCVFTANSTNNQYIVFAHSKTGDLTDYPITAGNSIKNGDKGRFNVRENHINGDFVIDLQDGRVLLLPNEMMEYCSLFTPNFSVPSQSTAIPLVDPPDVMEGASSLFNNPTIGLYFPNSKKLIAGQSAGVERATNSNGWNSLKKWIFTICESNTFGMSWPTPRRVIEEINPYFETQAGLPYYVDGGRFICATDGEATGVFVADGTRGSTSGALYTPPAVIYTRDEGDTWEHSEIISTLPTNPTGYPVNIRAIFCYKKKKTWVAVTDARPEIPDTQNGPIYVEILTSKNLRDWKSASRVKYAYDFTNYDIIIPALNQVDGTISLVPVNAFYAYTPREPAVLKVIRTI